jgi:hypothetical protein
MKTAHQGVAPSALPGLTGAGWVAAPQGNTSPGAPPNGGATHQPDQGGLDTWLLDKLFGRH